MAAPFEWDVFCKAKCFINTVHLPFISENLSLTEILWHNSVQPAGKIEVTHVSSVFQVVPYILLRVHFSV